MFEYTNFLKYNTLIQKINFSLMTLVVIIVVADKFSNSMTCKYLLALHKNNFRFYIKKGIFKKRGRGRGDQFGHRGSSQELGENTAP